MTMCVQWVILSLIASTAGISAPDAFRAPTDMRPARDGNIAIREELDAARRAATVEAYDLFIARHRDHPLAQIAREERQRLLDKHNSHKS